MSRLSASTFASYSSSISSGVLLEFRPTNGREMATGPEVPCRGRGGGGDVAAEIVSTFISGQAPSLFGRMPPLAGTAVESEANSKPTSKSK